MSYKAKTSLLASVLLAAALAACGAPGATAERGRASSPQPDVAPATTQAVSSPVPSPPPNPDRIKVVINTSTDYYKVFGSSSEEIFAYISAYGPIDDKGSRASGLTSYNPTLSWASNRTPLSCDIATMTIQVELKVLLPSLDNPSRLPATLQANWTKFAASVAAHEQRHVDIWVRGAETLREKMVALQAATSCSSLQVSVDEVWKSLQASTDQEQEAFHRDEKARTDSARVPISSQIEANKRRLESLTAQIETLDRSLASLTPQVGALETQLTSLKAQMTAIEEKYQGTGAPEDVLRQYDALRTQYNGLIPAYNALIDQYNSQVRQRNTLLAQAEDVRTRTNGLVEQYNWAR